MASASTPIAARVLNLPAAQRLRLAGRLVACVEDFATPDLAAARQTVLEQRLADGRSGHADALPADQVMAQPRRRFHEARRVSPARCPRTRRFG